MILKKIAVFIGRALLVLYCIAILSYLPYRLFVRRYLLDKKGCLTTAVITRVEGAHIEYYIKYRNKYRRSALTLNHKQYPIWAGKINVGERFYGIIVPELMEYPWFILLDCQSVILIKKPAEEQDVDTERTRIDSLYCIHSHAKEY